MPRPRLLVRSPRRHLLRHVVGAVAVAAVLASCGSDDVAETSATTEATGTTTAATDAAPETASSTTLDVTDGTGDPTSAACGQTTASAEQTKTFIFTHTDEELGVDSEPGSAFAHVKGVTIVTPAENTESLSVTISVKDGPTIATIEDMPPGSTCGIDHDFAPGDYYVRSSDGNGTQFTSFADD